MEVNASIDVGLNITGLLEKLATQIGVTSDKVFPWYVKQQVIEGYCGLILPLILLLAAAVILIASVKTFQWASKKDLEVINIICCLAGIFIVIGSMLSFMFGFSGNVGKINNPEYAATRAIVQDISKLR